MLPRSRRTGSSRSCSRTSRAPAQPPVAAPRPPCGLCPRRPRARAELSRGLLFFRPLRFARCHSVFLSLYLSLFFSFFFVVECIMHRCSARLDLRPSVCATALCRAVLSLCAPLSPPRPTRVDGRATLGGWVAGWMLTTGVERTAW